MQVDWSKVARLLEERLNPALPDGVYVRADNECLGCFGSDGAYGATELGWGEQPDDNEMLEHFVWAALSSVQDGVAHATRGLAWPDDPASSDPLPDAWAKIEDGWFSLGYGTIRLGDPVRLADLLVR